MERKDKWLTEVAAHPAVHRLVQTIVAALLAALATLLADAGLLGPAPAALQHGLVRELSAL